MYTNPKPIFDEPLHSLGSLSLVLGLFHKIHDFVRKLMRLPGTTFFRKQSRYTELPKCGLQSIEGKP